MKRVNKVIIMVILVLFLSSSVYAYSVRHHLINMGKNLIEFGFSPLYGLFVKAPQNIKKAYTYEVWGREKPEKRGLLYYRLFAIWRAPAEAMKGAIDGLVESVKAADSFSKEFLSIFFGD